MDWNTNWPSASGRYTKSSVRQPSNRRHTVISSGAPSEPPDTLAENVSSDPCTAAVARRSASASQSSNHLPVLIACSSAPSCSSINHRSGSAYPLDGAVARRWSLPGALLHHPPTAVATFAPASIIDGCDVSVASTGRIRLVRTTSTPLEHHCSGDHQDRRQRASIEPYGHRWSPPCGDRQLSVVHDWSSLLLPVDCARMVGTVG
jgi:hypothetical protein